MDSVLAAEIDAEVTEVYQLVGNKYSRLAKGSPEVGVVRYELVCFFVNSGCEEVQLEYGYVWMCFFLTHFTTNTSSTMQPCRIPATVFTRFVLAWVPWILFWFPTC